VTQTKATQSTQQMARPSLIEWSISAFVPPGETESGDMHLVKAVNRGVLAAMVDGVGHGTEAAAAARIAISTLESNADNKGIVALLHLCHQSLKGTRGAVIDLVSFDGDQNQMMWLGVGNVAGLLLRARAGTAGWTREGIPLRGGVVGYKLPPLQASVLPVGPGDTVVLATDGISPDFGADADTETSPKEMAARLCRKCATRRDDGLVMVVRYLGWNK
jgi:negative regulator of sigma-B (phosphoserine phosphatase)